MNIKVPLLFSLALSGNIKHIDSIKEKNVNFKKLDFSSIKTVPETIVEQTNKTKALRFLEDQFYKEKLYNLSTIDWHHILFNDKKASIGSLKHAINCLDYHDFSNTIPMALALLKYNYLEPFDSDCKKRLSKLNLKCAEDPITIFEKIGAPHIQFVFELPHTDQTFKISGTIAYFDSEEGTRDLIKVISNYIDHDDYSSVYLSIDKLVWKEDKGYQLMVAKWLIKDEISKMERSSKNMKNALIKSLKEFRKFRH